MIATNYKATVTRTLPRFATCEKCGCEYTFIATATGSAQRGLVIGMRKSLQKDADDSALIDANSKALSVPAACPDCGWYQKWMVPELRRLHHGWLRRSGLSLLACAGIAIAVEVFGYGDGDKLGTEEWIATLAAAALGGILLGVHWSLTAKHNPNASYPQRPRSRTGEPIAARTPQYQARLDAQQAAMAQVDWYYIPHRNNDKVRRGPVSRERLIAMFKEGTLSPDDWTWSEGMSDWIPARKTLL